MKTFYVQYGIGKAKYVLNYHDGEKCHRDGSPAFDVAVPRTKRELNKRIAQLRADGYVEK